MKKIFYFITFLQFLPYKGRKLQIKKCSVNIVTLGITNVLATKTRDFSKISRQLSAWVENDLSAKMDRVQKSFSSLKG